jgi:hypothetical protein
MKIKVRVSTHLVRSETYRIIEVPDDATEEDIEEEARDSMFEQIEWNWEKVED